MAENEKIRQRLRITIHSLRRYVHLPTCTEIYSCPNKHPNCQKRLGLDTAIAWELADELAALLDYFMLTSTFSDSIRDWLIQKIERTFTKTEAFRSLLQRHAQSYCQLLSELENVEGVLSWLRLKV